MLTAMLASLSLGVGSGVVLGSHSPEDFSIWLERAGGTSVVVVSEWQGGDLQGWSWGLCHDPAQARIDCPDGPGDPCRAQGCAAVACTDDLGTCNDGDPPAYHLLSVHENGITQGAVHNFC